MISPEAKRFSAGCPFSMMISAHSFTLTPREAKVMLLLEVMPIGFESIHSLHLAILCNGDPDRPK
jgi:hypothetical protein